MLQKQIRLLLISFISPGLLSACSHFTTEIGAPRVNTDTLTETRYSQVPETYGPPSQIHGVENGFYFLYENATIDANQLGLSLDFIIPDLLSFVIATGDAQLEVLLIAFDYEGYQTNIVRNAWEQELGKGSGFQFIFAPIPLVDDSSVRIIAPQNQWGMQLLLVQDDELIRISEERLIILGSPVKPLPNKP